VLPDFIWHIKPKLEKYTKLTTKYTKLTTKYTKLTTKHTKLTTKYTKRSLNIPNGHIGNITKYSIRRPRPSIGNFYFKIYHLATLVKLPLELGSWAGLPDFSWYNIPNWEKYTKWPQNIIYDLKFNLMAIQYTKHLPMKDPLNFTQNWIFGLKIYHLATLELGARIIDAPHRVPTS
jgi:hypothetical protein